MNKVGIVIFVDALTHHRLKRLVAAYNTTIPALLHDLVESEWAKKKGLERKEVKKDGTTKSR